jgi:ADP-heptose:LPS heptosyltransferase
LGYYLSAKWECNGKLSDNQRTVEFDSAEDWGIVIKFPQIKHGALKYNNSSLINNKLCSIDHLPLPVHYCVISPYSSDKRIRTRDFTDDDWAATIYYLIKRNMTAVVLNSGNEYVPNNPCLINLSGKTSFVEAVEVMKKASGYIGIDSSMSVLAAKLFEYPNFMVKSQNDHCYSNKQIYYAPQTKFNFLNTAIAKLIPKE